MFDATDLAVIRILHLTFNGWSWKSRSELLIVTPCSSWVVYVIQDHSCFRFKFKFKFKFKTDICTRQLMNITLARTAKNVTIIKYIHERKTKKINQLWKSGISVLFWRSGAKVRDHASQPGASSTQQMRRNRTHVDPVSSFLFEGHTVVGQTSRMRACWHDRRKLKPECTDRIGNQELDHGGICRPGGRSYSSPGLPHLTSATADAWLPTQMIDTAAAVPAWQPRGGLPRVCPSGNADRKRAARYSSWYEYVWAPVPEHEQRPRWGIDGSTDDSQLSELEEADTRNVVDMPRQRHPTVDEDSQISDTVNGSKVDVRHPHSGTTAVMQTTARAQPNQLRLWRVETKSVWTHPRLDALDARGHPRS